MQVAVLLTVQYSDLFDYPLSLGELREYLCLLRASRAAVEETVNTLTPQFLTRLGALVCWRGREAIFDLRIERQERSQQRLRLAQRFAGWMRSVPFVRLVGISGSQAVGNAREDSDLDLFILTTPRRLWIVQFCASFLRHFGRVRFGVVVCPNFYLTMGSLELSERNLYTAREIAQMQPLWGAVSYAAFRRANSWINRLLPNLDPHSKEALISGRVLSPWVQTTEGILGGWAGDTLDYLLYTLLLVYYRLRLAGRGWNLADLRTWYTRHHLKVMQGGYAPVVMARFKRQVGRRLGTCVDSVWWDQLETWTSAAELEAVFDELMRENYEGTP